MVNQKDLGFNTVCSDLLCSTGGSGQPMGARPGLGVSTPRAMPPYKYATAVRNTQPQVVQPITLQQVCLYRTKQYGIMTWVIPQQCFRILKSD